MDLLRPFLGNGAGPAPAVAAPGTAVAASGTAGRPLGQYPRSSGPLRPASRDISTSASARAGRRPTRADPLRAQLAAERPSRRDVYLRRRLRCASRRSKWLALALRP